MFTLNSANETTLTGPTLGSTHFRLYSRCSRIRLRGYQVAGGFLGGASTHYYHSWSGWLVGYVPHRHLCRVRFPHYPAIS